MVTRLLLVRALNFKRLLSLYNLHAEYIMRNAELEETQAGIKIPGEISITSDMQMTPPLWQKVVTGWGIDLDYHDIEWFALEMNRDHSVFFEIASK